MPNIALIAALVLTTAATAQAQPCALTAKGVTVCGQGETALTVLAGTLSPSGQIAVGWRRTNDAPRSELPDAAHVEHYIVRLADGKLLGRSIGRSWNDGEMKSNHIDLLALWSPDERWLMLGDIGRFSLVDLAIYSVNATAGTAQAHGLMEPLVAAANPKLQARVGRKAFEQYELQIPHQGKATLTNAGKVTLPLEFHIPRGDKRHGLVATIAVSLQNSRIKASRPGIRFTRN
jgi:hypothetical protein